MKRSLVWLLAASVVLIVAIVLVLRRSDAPGPPADVVASNASDADAKAEIPAPAVEPQTSGENPDPRRAEAAPVESVPPPSAPAADELAELRGRFVLPDGSPAAGVRLQVRGWVGNSERAMKHGKPDDWQDPKGSSEADGRFSFRFDPPLAYQFVLEADLAGYAKVLWRWHELPPHKVTDVGEIVLSRAGAVRGRIVDKQGKPVPGDWMCYADASYQPPGEGGDSTRVRAPADAATSEFLLEGLPPGPAKLKAYSRIANWIEGPTVVIANGETANADIVYDGPDNSRRIVVVTFCKLFHTFSNPMDGSIVALHGASEIQAVKVAGSSQSWSFDDLEPGSYTIEVRDPRYKPWSSGAVSPGRSIDAKLEGSSAVVLAVQDEAGAPVEDYRLRLTFRNVNFMPNEFELRAKGAPLPPGGLYDALIPSDFTLSVDAPGYPPCNAQVDALAPGETRAVNVQLARGVNVRGAVLDGTTRAPIADVQVRLGSPPPAAAEGDPKAFLLRRMGRDPAGSTSVETRTDAQGRFEFQNVAPGSYELRARRNVYLDGASGPFVVEPGVERVVDVLLPSSGFLVGRVIGPSGASFEGLSIDAVPRKEDGSQDDGWLFASLDPQPLGTLAADGGYRLGPLPAGEVDVVLVGRESSAPQSFQSRMGIPGARRPLGTATIEGGKETRRDFDLGDGFPGKLRLTIRIDGAPGASLVAIVESLAGEPNSMRDSQAAQSDAQGNATLGPLFPGDWKLVVRPVDSEWSWSPPAPVRIASNAEASLAIDISLIDGMLLVLADDDGKPLANRRIHIWLGTAGIERRTDTEGNLRLRLPTGSLGVSDGGDPAEYATWDLPRVQVEWTVSGPGQGTVRLPRAPKGRPMRRDG